MQNKIFHSKAHLYLSMGIAFCLPLGRLTPIFIVLLLLNWIIEGELKNKFNSILKNKWLWLFISLYLIHVAGLLFTENNSAGMFDLEVKLSLLVFPFIYSSRPLSAKQINSVFTAFVAGGILSSLFMLSRAAFLFFARGENNFFYEAFSVLVHPSYISMYFNFLMAWILLGLLRKGELRSSFKPFYSWILIFFFSFINVLLSSKLGMLSMGLMFFSFGIYYIRVSKYYLAGSIGILLFLTGIILSAKYIPAIEHRVSFAIAALTKEKIDKASDESSEVRMLIWDASNEIIANHFLTGVGTGDAKDVLMATYEKRGMTGAIGHKLNAHNEFYQVFLSVGVIGFLLLLSGLVFPLIRSFRKGPSLYTIFLILIILNFIPESMLETQAGVMFYAFVNSMLFFYLPENTIEISVNI